MANRFTKIRELSSRLDRYRRSGSTLAQFCRDEQVSVPSFYYWRNRLTSMHLESDEVAIQDSISSSASSSSCFRFTIHVGNVRTECQSGSMHAIESVLAWASRNQESKFQQVIVQC
jgi:hypothetical protein